MRSPLLFPLLLLATASLTTVNVLSKPNAAIAQERQGCYMINNIGRFIDLSTLCPMAAAGQVLGTGDIQATLRWNAADDLDLSVTDPAGESVTFANRSISSGGQLDVDANANCDGTTNTPVENVFWPTGRAPQGSFNVEVNLYTRCNNSRGPIPFTLTLLVQGRTQTLAGQLDEANPRASFPFTVPLANAAPGTAAAPTAGTVAPAAAAPSPTP